MNQKNNDQDWYEFAHPEFRLQFRYPAMTPEGRTVHRADERRDGAVGVHLTAEGSQELYIEVVRFFHLSPGDEYTRHKAQLDQRFGAGSVTSLTQTSFGRDWPAWTYAFRGNIRGNLGERSVLLLPVATDTYRVIYDPRSPLNLKVIASITIGE